MTPWLRGYLLATATPAVAVAALLLTVPSTAQSDPALAALLGPAVGYVAQSEQHGGDPDGDVDEEDPAPRDQVCEDAAEQQPNRTATGADGTERAERPRALAALREGSHDDRQGSRRDEPLISVRVSRVMARLRCSLNGW